LLVSITSAMASVRQSRSNSGTIVRRKRLTAVDGWSPGEISKLQRRAVAVAATLKGPSFGGPAGKQGIEPTPHLQLWEMNGEF
jgi:hypothetical protein